MSFSVLLLIFATFATVAGDYPCVCNYNVEAAVHLLPDDNSEALGYMYEFDCKPAGVGQGNINYLEIMFEGKVSKLGMMHVR
ncbi:hypothetical protein DPMN_128906 [Dreissena polymorpha]|uniref:Uncharacterized protein n=1 Tax=Dreissena polymorpha TaxID=45954 RepID=A0A9D4H3Y8_DREPO|nr:hypothetical protein DPMN_128906 [Dreissena polymorpha]